VGYVLLHLRWFVGWKRPHSIDALAVVAEDELTAVRLLVHRAHAAIDTGHLGARTASSDPGCRRKAGLGGSIGVAWTLKTRS
jgi:hypothetical protein